MAKKWLKSEASRIRIFRKIHRLTALILLVFFFIIAGSSLLLGWKKNSNGLILPKTQRGVSTELKNWLPLDSLQQIAFSVVNDSVDSSLDVTLSKMDIRPDKGVIKFIFENHYWEVQVDGSTGKVLSVSVRYSDLIENIHDGSILDQIFKTRGGIFKLYYTSLMSLALFVFIITGFWLWYAPKRIKKRIKKPVQ